MQRTGQLALVILATCFLAVGCTTQASGDGEVSGVVSEVTGTDGSVASFVVLADDGQSHKFVPAPDMGAEIGSASLRDLVISGHEVRVAFKTGSRNELIATFVALLET